MRRQTDTLDNLGTALCRGSRRGNNRRSAASNYERGPIRSRVSYQPKHLVGCRRIHCLVCGDVLDLAKRKDGHYIYQVAPSATPAWLDGVRIQTTLLWSLLDEISQLASLIKIALTVLKTMRSTRGICYKTAIAFGLRICSGLTR